MGNEWGDSGNSVRLYFLGSVITADVTAAMKLKDAYSLEGKLCPPRQHIKKQRHYFAHKGRHKGRLVEAVIFPVVMYGCEN